MPIYEFRCEACGTFDASYPMLTVPRRSACPGCGTDARRLFSAAGLVSPNSPAVRALDSAARSAEAPSIVGAPPPQGRGAPVSRDPRHLKLPRP